MFRKLCGDDALKNVVIVTNMWEEVDPQIGDAREAELIREDIFFKPALDKGARMARHKNTASSADNVIRLILDNDPLPLCIQTELVTEHKEIPETSAGEELNQELNSQITKHQEEMRVLKEEMEQARDNKDEETRRELEIEAKRMQGEIARFENDAKRLASDYVNKKGNLRTRFASMEAEARRETDRIIAQYQREIEELSYSLRTNRAASERERKQMVAQMNELSRKRDRAHTGSRSRRFFSTVGAIVDSLIFG